MSKKQQPVKHWADEILDVSKPIEVEPFSSKEPEYNPNLIEFNGYLCVANRQYGGKKINYALRIEEDINTELEKCQGSKNAVINALCRFALAELKKQNKTLLTD